MAKTVAPQPLIDEATQADLLFRESWSGLRFHKREFGRACKWIQEKELHKYIPKPNSAVGYQTFDGYVANVTGGECSRSTIYECILLHDLTLGAVAIPPEVVDAMPHKNALKLSKVINKLPPDKKTKKNVAKIAEQARKEPVNTFKVTAQKEINKHVPPVERKLPFATLVLHLDPRAVDTLKQTIEDFKLIRGAVRDGDLTLDLASKAVLLICALANESAAAEIQAVKAKAQREAPVISEAVSDKTSSIEEENIYEAPDLSVRQAKAYDEGRVVHRKSETPN